MHQSRNIFLQVARLGTKNFKLKICVIAHLIELNELITLTYFVLAEFALARAYSPREVRNFTTLGANISAPEHFHGLKIFFP